MPNTWPMQAGCDAFYGNPRGRNGTASASWIKANLVTVPVPWKMRTAWEPGSSVSRIQIHNRCSGSLARVLAAIWEKAGKRQDVIETWGMHLFGGSFAFRTMRGSSRLSMHSWGCAVDFDPARNGLGDYTPAFQPDHAVVLAFKAEGWVWGGDWDGNGRVSDERRPDAMHFQAARV